MKRIVKFNEMITEAKVKERLVQFYDELKSLVDELEESEHMSNVDILSEVGKLMNRYDLSTDDLQAIVDMYTDDYYIERYVQPQLEYEIEEEERYSKMHRHPAEEVYVVVRPNDTVLEYIYTDELAAKHAAKEMEDKDGNADAPIVMTLNDAIDRLRRQA